MLYKKGVFEDYAKFTGKHLYQSLFFNKVAGLSLQIFKNISFTKYLQVTASRFALKLSSIVMINF